jgi:hypothetical protein
VALANSGGEREHDQQQCRGGPGKKADESADWNPAEKIEEKHSLFFKPAAQRQLGQWSSFIM